MKFTFTVIPVEGEITRGDIDWPREPGYLNIKALVEPLLGKDEPLEHVTVAKDGRRTDMFISELGHVTLTTRGPLPFNARASVYYPWGNGIAGTAIVFDQIVWT